ncbi:homeobox protein 22 [Striga asiatica]|uniref:Homeobox protein 22 n=1 Tax=Striga asiatica TaxID=4170 RepID=A0A5A7QD77_STRAF|nr:homeobox protein 22 [Striga asiatica]
MANTSTNYSRVELVAITHQECLHNHAAALGEYILDGCALFQPGGPNGSPTFKKCATCGCHLNFHKRVEVEFPHPNRVEITDLQIRAPALQQNPVRRAPEPEILDLPSHEPQIHEEGPAGHRRFLTSEQKARLREIIESNNWKMFRDYSPEEVEQVCAEVGIPRKCLKNWVSSARRERRQAGER